MTEKLLCLGGGGVMECGMARIVYVHWHEAELRERSDRLTLAGHEVIGHWSSGSHFRMEGSLPDAVIVSLDRLPSHGRAVAEWWRETKKRRSIPLYFVGGPAEKAAALLAQFPGTIGCAASELEAALGRDLGS